MSAEPKEAVQPRKLSFPFAKRHGVLVRGVADGVADTVCRPGVTPLSLAEVRRFVGVPLRLQRLSVDPMEVYGTNCVKFSGAALDTSAAWLQRELRIVQPRLVVVMGDDALDFLNGIGFQKQAFGVAPGAGSPATQVTPPPGYSYPAYQQPEPRSEPRPSPRSSSSAWR